MARADADLIGALERSNIHPLWDRYKRITPVAPGAKDAPMHWRWRDLEPFTERAAREVAIEDVERRALILANPAFGGDTVTTQNLIGAFTVLEPGDKAVPHRRGDPLLHARRRRLHHRQRPALRHAGGRPGADAANVLARSHQRERPAHRVVRRRQHAGDLRARRQLLRAGGAPGRALLGSE